MKGVFKHLRTYIFRGLLAIVPLALSFFSLKILYTAIDKRVRLIIEKYLGFTFPGLGVLLVFASLYLLGLIASNVVGKQFFGLVERIANGDKAGVRYVCKRDATCATRKKRRRTRPGLRISIMPHARDATRH